MIGSWVFSSDNCSGYNNLINFSEDGTLSKDSNLGASGTYTLEDNSLQFNFQWQNSFTFPCGTDDQGDDTFETVIETYNINFSGTLSDSNNFSDSYSEVLTLNSPLTCWTETGSSCNGNMNDIKQ